YHQWGNETTSTYHDAFSGETVHRVAFLTNEQGVFARIEADGQGTQHVTLFHRDASGFLSEIILPGEQQPRRFTYNTAGDLESETIPAMGSYYYFYDARGRQIVPARVSPGGQMDVIETDYDFQNRRIAERVNGQTTVTYKYDRAVELASAAAFTMPIALPVGQPVEISHLDPNGLFDMVQRYGYDHNGRLVQHEVLVNGQTYSESYSLTLDGRITRSIDPGGMES